MKRKTDSWETILVASLVLIAGICAQSQQAVRADDDTELNGPIVQIDQDANHQDLSELTAEPKTRIIEEPTFWIGIRGRSVESEVLRTHLQLAEDMGAVIEEVLPESPAAKAGLRKHDIILRAAGDAVDNMRVLQSQVNEGGDKPIELKIIRFGKPEKVVVVPEKRPHEFNKQVTDLGANRWGVLNGEPQDLLNELLGGEGRLGAHRVFGPGIIVNGLPEQGTLPNGVSISLKRQNGGPPEITVKKGEETWNIVGDDAKTLNQLPEDVRPMVEQMLSGKRNLLGGGFSRDLNTELQRVLPRGLGGAAGGDPVTDRIEQLEKKLLDLQKRLEQEPVAQ